MPGGYTHTNRADHDNLTASIYNSSHQNHIDNRIPAKIDDYSLDVDQMRLVGQSGSEGSEILASSLGTELEYLREALRSIKGSGYWYETGANRSVNLFANMPIAVAPTVMPPTGTTTFYISWRVPVSYLSGDLLYSIGVRPLTVISSGSVVALRLTVIRYRAGSAPSTLINAININYTGDNSDHIFVKSVGVDSGTFAVGDFLAAQFFRLGSDSSDTSTANVSFAGATMSYTCTGGLQ